ncbi:MAG: hypothetical protein H7A23_12085 [Leptospiraceae bacterium]|nr:hypothetical protein [Leptospiraceae bacterium]
MRFLKYFLLLAIFLSSVSLFSQDKSKTESTKEEKSHKKWYLYLGTGKGNMDDGSEDEITTIHTRFGFEYRPIPQIGLNFGPSRTKLNIKSPGDLYDLLLVKTFLDSGVSLGFYSFTLLGSLYYALPHTVSYDINTLDFTFKYHFLGDKRFDPYIGLGLGLGACGGGGSCTAGKLIGNIGLQINFDTFFTFVQAEHHSITLKTKGDDDEAGSVSATENLLLLGAGIRF